MSTVDSVVKSFFENSGPTYVDLSRLEKVFGNQSKLVIERIVRRIDEDVTKGKAVKTCGSIGDDGGGLFDSDFTKAYSRSERDGILWYHFDSEIIVYGISRHVPGYKGEAIQVV